MQAVLKSERCTHTLKTLIPNCLNKEIWLLLVISLYHVDHLLKEMASYFDLAWYLYPLSMSFLPTF